MKRILVFVFLMIFLITFVSAGFFYKQQVCGDNTSDATCSINKPYFCFEKTLSERASVCGCPNLTEIQEDSCVSQYQKQPKEINLKYILNGQEKNLSFVVYKNLTDYLFNLPKFITYSNGEQASLWDFKSKKINEENQRIFLMPLVVKIQNLTKNKQDQVRIAISLVQNIYFEDSKELVTVGNYSVNYSRYPYEVLYEEKGVCASKSNLLVFLLKGLGYESVFLHYRSEEHTSNSSHTDISRMPSSA